MVGDEEIQLDEIVQVSEGGPRRDERAMVRLTPNLMQLVNTDCDRGFCQKERRFISEVVRLFCKKKQPCDCGCGCGKQCCTVCLRTFLGSFKATFDEVGGIPETQCNEDACKRLHKFFLKSQNIVERLKDKSRCKRCESYCDCTKELCWACSASCYDECRTQFFRLEDKNRCKTCVNDVMELFSDCSASCHQKCKAWSAPCYQKCEGLCSKASNCFGCCYNKCKKIYTNKFYRKVIFEVMVPAFATILYTVFSFAAWLNFLDQKEPGLVYGVVDKGYRNCLNGLIIFRFIMANMFYIYKYMQLVKLLKGFPRFKFLCQLKKKYYEKGKQIVKCAHVTDKKSVKWDIIEHSLKILMIIENLSEDIIWIIIYTCYEKRDDSYLAYRTILQIVMSFFKTMWSALNLSQNKFKRKHTYCIILQWTVLFGIIIQLVLSSVLAYLVLVYTKKGGQSFYPRLSTSLQSPDSIDTDWYLHDVSLFLNKAGQPEAWRSNSSSNAWMQLFYLDEIMENDQIMFKFKYQNSTTGTVNMATWKKVVKTDTNWTLSGCYSLSTFIERLWPCPEELMNSSDTYFMKFQYVSNATYFIGQIFFNMKVEENGTVWDWNTYALARNITQPYSAMFRYFRHWTQSESFLYHSLFNKTSFYDGNSAELIDVVNIWRTGFLTCPCKSSLWPVLDPNLDFSIE